MDLSPSLDVCGLGAESDEVGAHEDAAGAHNDEERPQGEVTVQRLHR